MWRITIRILSSFNGSGVSEGFNYMDVHFRTSMSIFWLNLHVCPTPERLFRIEEGKVLRSGQLTFPSSAFQDSIGTSSGQREQVKTTPCVSLLPLRGND